MPTTAAKAPAKEARKAHTPGAGPQCHNRPPTSRSRATARRIRDRRPQRILRKDRRSGAAYQGWYWRMGAGRSDWSSSAGKLLLQPFLDHPGVQALGGFHEHADQGPHGGMLTGFVV